MRKVVKSKHEREAERRREKDPNVPRNRRKSLRIADIQRITEKYYDRALQNRLIEYSGWLSNPQEEEPYESDIPD